MITADEISPPIIIRYLSQRYMSKGPPAGRNAEILRAIVLPRHRHQHGACLSPDLKSGWLVEEMGDQRFERRDWKRHLVDHGVFIRYSSCRRMYTVPTM